MVLYIIIGILMYWGIWIDGNGLMINGKEYQSCGQPMAITCFILMLMIGGGSGACKDY